jgi:phage shock protein A
VLGGGKTSETLKADLDQLNVQLDALKRDVSALNQKLQIFTAELAARPA